MECPYRYKLAFIEKLPVTKVDTIEADVGKFFHQFAADFFTEMDVETLFKCNAYDEVISLFNLYVEPTFPKLVLPLCRNFVQWEAIRFLALKAGGLYRYYLPLEIEKEFTDVRFDPYTDIILDGHIDRVDPALYAGSIIIEYKTHQTFKFPKDELYYYALLLRLIRYKPRPKYIAVYNPRHNRFEYEEIKQSGLRRMRRWILKFVSSVKSEIFEKFETARCRFCPYLSHCMWGDSL